MVGRLRGWLGTRMGVPLCPSWLALNLRAMSHTTGQAVARREGRHEYWVRVRVGPHLRCSHLLRAAVLHVHACVGVWGL